MLVSPMPKYISICCKPSVICEDIISRLTGSRRIFYTNDCTWKWYIIYIYKTATCQYIFATIRTSLNILHNANKSWVTVTAIAYKIIPVSIVSEMCSLYSVFVLS